MAQILPFKGIFYNQAKVELPLVVTPPYDVISERQRDLYYERHAHNFIRLILGKEKHESAAGFFRQWLEDKILIEDQKPALYAYQQEFSIKGEKKTRLGFMALLKLEEFEAGVVFPHEWTFAKPREDRLDLMRATQANFEAVFGIYSDPDFKIKSLFKLDRPAVELKDEKGEGHKIWPVYDRPIIREATERFKDKKVYIADGHHRYEAALEYRREMKKGPAEYVMMFLLPREDPGLIILPTHRLLKSLGPLSDAAIRHKIKQFFEVESFDLNEKETWLAKLKVHGQGRPAFGFYLKDGQYHLAVLKDEKMALKLMKLEKPEVWKKLDLVILHVFMLEKLFGVEASKENNLGYTMDEEEALSKVDSGEQRLAFFLNPTKIEEVVAVAEAGERMPQKSTYFYPKLLSGLIARKIE